MSFRNLQNNLSAWRDIGANNEVLKWIEFGVELQFVSQPISYSNVNRIKNSVEESFVDAEILKLSSKGAISEVQYTAFCVSALSCVAKKGNKLRLVTDLSPLNEYVKSPYFKNEGIDNVCDLLQSGDSMITVDLKDGFHHISINQEYRTYLGFMWRRSYYVWNVLPFGLNASPYFFNKTIRCVVQYLRCISLRVHFWVDDGLLMSQPDNITEHKLIFLSTLSKLGICVNWDKSSVEPDCTKEYVGYIVNSLGPDNVPWIKIPSQRILKLRRDLRRALRSVTIKARFLAKICGQCISFTKAILPAKLLLRNLYRVLRSRNSWDDTLLLDRASVSDIQWWLESLQSWNGRSITKRTVDKQIFTDASSSGWGAACDSLKASGL